MSSPELSRPDALAHRYVLGPDETQIINLSGEPLAPPEATYAEHGLTAPKVAEIDASGHQLSILDMRQHTSCNAPLVVVDGNFKASGGQLGYRGIRDNEPERYFGRGWDRERFSYPPTVSANHFSVALRGLEIHIRNLRPTNTTTLSGHLVGMERKIDDSIVDMYTINVRHDLRNHHSFEAEDETAPYGYYRGHAIIGRNSKTVRDGVYFTTRPRSEAVVVDHLSPELRYAQYDLHAKAARRLTGHQGPQQVRDALELVNSYTQELMPYNLRKVEAICGPYYDDMDLINLSEFVRLGAGVCRHQNLLAALFIDLLIESGYVQGKVGVQRNHDIEANGAHAWAVLKQPNEESLIVDPAQNFVGTPEEAQARGLWKYIVALDR